MACPRRKISWPMVELGDFIGDWHGIHVPLNWMPPRLAWGKMMWKGREKVVGPVLVSANSPCWSDKWVILLSSDFIYRLHLISHTLPSLRWVNACSYHFWNLIPFLTKALSSQAWDWGIRGFDYNNHHFHAFAVIEILEAKNKPERASRWRTSLQSPS